MTLDPIPAHPPIDGPFWTVVVPAALLVVATAATWLLYRRFSTREGGRSGGC